MDVNDPGRLGQRLLARQLDEQLSAAFGAGQKLRVLDVGLGRGVQALRLARAGHTVTGLQSDPDLRELFEKELADEDGEVRGRIRLHEGGSEDTGAHFLPGTFDVVLCHAGLSQARDPGTTLAGLARVLGAGGLLSLLIRNDAALAMRPGRSGDWDAALAAIGFPERTGSALRLETLSRSLAGIGTPLRQWYGVGVFGHHDVPDDETKAEKMLDAEELAGRSDPYRSVAAMLHICGVRGGAGGDAAAPTGGTGGRRDSAPGGQTFSPS
ncbi:class I SAM-dependent methyltransferase [Streptomyces winkii]|uniref:class I SAM-dependent methyltransferase n=1 Tax=Streptomyces winkii TaxID=3051178 RepID=UPI0028D4C3B5|nr:methyltransferase domain-containing protein [Streptomyces sp. DSM 40971]